MIPQFSHSDLRTAVNDEVHGTVNPGATTQEDRILRRAVRFVVNDIDLRSTKRRAMLSLSGANDIANEGVQGNYSSAVRTDIGEEMDDYWFHAPFDLKGNALIDIQNRYAKRAQYEMVFEEEFQRKKTAGASIVATKDGSSVRQLLVGGIADTTQTTLHNCDTVAGDGTWTAAGDASSAATITSNYIDGVGAVSFTLITAAATGTLTNSDMTAVDLSGSTSDSIYMWVYVPMATGLTSFALKWGSSASAYYSYTVTQTHDATTFHKGWNLLRFPYIGATETGTVDDENIDYIQLTVVKGATNTGTTGWIMDGIRAQKDTEHDVIYYSKYGWQNTSGVYMEESTADGDLLNCDSDEFELMVLKGAEYVSRGVLNSAEDAQEFAQAYERKKQTYTMDSPSERMTITYGYQDLGGVEGFADYETNLY